MTDRSKEPLTEMDKRVFGVDAKRRPDGSIRQQGSSHDPLVMKLREEEDRRAAEAVKPERQIDLREVHDLHQTKQ